MTTSSDGSTDSAAVVAHLEAALAAKLTLQEVSVRMAKGVAAAYTAYNNGSNNAPSLPGYHGFNAIYAWESDPNINPFSVLESAVDSETADATVRRPAAYTSHQSLGCVVPQATGTPGPGSQLFGFTATADDQSHNILVLRGTVTLQEAGVDLIGWGDNVPCMLPSQSSTPTSYGSVNSALYDFYVDADGGVVTSLALSCLNAIQASLTNDPNGAAWYFGAHSLGGAMVQLAALDTVASGILGKMTPAVFTFGSLHVGLIDFAAAYTRAIPTSVRFANLCDFVPSMVSLEPVNPTNPYVHAGTEATFVWQTWDDWANHSLVCIYQVMVETYWQVIKWGKRKYPQ